MREKMQSLSNHKLDTLDMGNIGNDVEKQEENLQYFDMLVCNDELFHKELRIVAEDGAKEE